MSQVLRYFIQSIILYIHMQVVYSCISAGRSSLRGRPGRGSDLEPLIYGQYVPNRPELSISASGPLIKKITRDSPDFTTLVENNNMDIVFKDEEKTNADRMMSNRCKDKLNSLAIMVLNQWPGVKPRVIEGWDEDGAHADDSLHYEGRAVDITTSDKDRGKLSLLARLAYDAGFDYVSYESKHHIHCSVKSDDEYNTMSSGLGSGCFPAGSYVTMADSSHKRIEDLDINDRVLSVASDTGEIISDTVFMFLDRNPASKHHFVELIYEDGSLTLTDHHLVYAADDNATDLEASVPIYAADVLPNSYIYMNMNNSIVQHQVLRVKRVVAKGIFAPLTLSGNIIVNDVVTSCYASTSSHWLAHMALSPLRLLYQYYNVAVLNTFEFTEPQIGVHWYAKFLTDLFPFLLS